MINFKEELLKFEPVLEIDGIEKSIYENELVEIYVPDSLVESYKVATNWVNFNSQIKGLSELEG